MAMPKSVMRKEKKSKEDENTSADLSSAHRCSQAKCWLVNKPVTLNKQGQFPQISIYATIEMFKFIKI